MIRSIDTTITTYFFHVKFQRFLLLLVTKRFPDWHSYRHQSNQHWHSPLVHPSFDRSRTASPERADTVQVSPLPLALVIGASSRSLSQQQPDGLIHLCMRPRVTPRMPADRANHSAKEQLLVRNRASRLSGWLKGYVRASRCYVISTYFVVLMVVRPFGGGAPLDCICISAPRNHVQYFFVVV